MANDPDLVIDVLVRVDIVILPADKTKPRGRSRLKRQFWDVDVARAFLARVNETQLRNEFEPMTVEQAKLLIAP